MSRLFYLLTLLLFLQNVLFAQEEKAIDAPIPGTILVMLSPGATIKKVVADVNAEKSVFDQIIATEALGGVHPLYLLRFHPFKTKAAHLLAAVKEHPAVIAAQFDYEISYRQTPDDPDYGKQWGLERIGAPEVWNYTTGGLTARGDTIVVAILDDGFDIDHVDLQQNVWHNRFEIANDGIDNDNNGYIDDIYGWSFPTNSNIPIKTSHGTSVAGIVGAHGNNGIGVTGVNWNIKLMLLSTSRVSEIIKAYEYVIEQRKRYNESGGKQGAFVVATNASFGREREFCDTQQPVWAMMYDLMGEQGVLTGAGTVNTNLNVDEVGDVPTSCSSDFIITCLNITQQDRASTSTGYGKKTIDLGAPGDDSYSTKAYNNYGSFNSNSAAAPHLTGAIALLYGLPCDGLAEEALTRPRQTALLVRDAILKGAEPLADLQNKTVTGGVVNVFRSLQKLQNQCGTQTGDLHIVKLYPNPADKEILIEYETPDFEAYSIRAFNALGQLMYQNTVTPPRFSFKREQIDVHNWAAGFYIVILEKGDQRVHQSFIVQ